MRRRHCDVPVGRLSCTPYAVLQSFFRYRSRSPALRAIRRLPEPYAGSRSCPPTLRAVRRFSEPSAGSMSRTLALGAIHQLSEPSAGSQGRSPALGAVRPPALGAVHHASRPPSVERDSLSTRDTRNGIPQTAGGRSDKGPRGKRAGCGRGGCWGRDGPSLPIPSLTRPPLNTSTADQRCFTHARPR